MRYNNQRNVSISSVITILLVGNIIFATPKADASVAIQTAKEFLYDVLQRPSSLLEESEDTYCELVGLPYKIIIADAILGETRYILYVPEDGSTIYSYSFRGALSGEGEESTEDLVSEDNAFAAAVPLLNYLNLSTNKSHYQVILECADNVNNGHENVPRAIWRIYKELSIDDIPCRTRFFSSSISALSGNIFSFDFYPAIAPENSKNQLVTYTDACETAAGWLNTQPYFSGTDIVSCDAESNGVFIIAPKHNFFDIEQLLTPACENSDLYPIESRYSWEVPFTWTEYSEYEYQGAVWIDVETGEVVGAAPKP